MDTQSKFTLYKNYVTDSRIEPRVTSFFSFKFLFFLLFFFFGGGRGRAGEGYPSHLIYLSNSTTHGTVIPETAN